MKKHTKSSKTAKKSATATVGGMSALDKLNALNHERGDVYAAIKEEYKKAIDGSSAAFKTLCRKADELGDLIEEQKKSMPPVKFDIGNGEFFYANEYDGQETFAVKVRLVKECIVRVPAKSLEAAMSVAKDIARKESANLETVVEAIDYAR